MRQPDDNYSLSNNFTIAKTLYVGVFKKMVIHLKDMLVRLELCFSLNAEETLKLFLKLPK